MKNHIILLVGIAGTGKRTVGLELTALAGDDTRFVHHHAWTDPIVRLFGHTPDAFWHVTESAWSKINLIRDTIFSCIAEDCPEDDNFVITFEMLANNPYHESFYNEVLKLVQARNAVFYPIRLVCSPEEIAKRVISPDRTDYLKTQDAEMVQKRATEHEVFYTHHDNEISLDITELSAADAAKTILSQIT
ncbi:MAG: hypothetical protein P1U32_05085 [Legionellaceae bacterium]|nr:hypothetical protein [Legionellaceae bacterium]